MSKNASIHILLASLLATGVGATCETDPPKWYPSGGSDWTNGFCKNERQCNGNYGSGYSTELACCQGAYGGQTSGVCLSNLPAPPTTSPTIAGGIGDKWYPDYDTAWSEAGCKADLPVPSGRPNYDTQLECCKGSYGGQVSGKCLSELASPPTTSPTIAGGIGNKWYPDYDTAWSEAGCKADVPLPFSPNSRPTYDTQLECCKGSYAGQTSGKCLSELASPPTTSPTMSGGVIDFWYPDYDSAWSVAGCKNELPLPFNRGDRPEYATHLECCKNAYGGQTSGQCLSELASPPTTSPTIAGGIGDKWYPDYETAWSEAGCKADLPVPSGRPNYDTHLECCKGAYGGQTSGKCLSQLASPPTTSPTIAGGIGDKWYPDYDTAWSEAGCKADLPVPSGRPNYDTQLECCKAAYGGQTSGKCLSELASPPTTSPTIAGGIGNKWYPDYDTAWSEAGCKADVPLPFSPNSRPTYDTQLECCKGSYAGQTSGKCLSELASPPTTSPTISGGVIDFWYPDYSAAWSDAGCKNELPLPFTRGDRPEYATHLECCKNAYGGQTSGKCLSELASPPTTSPTNEGNTGSEYYPDYQKAWPDGVCINQLPVPSGRPTYSSKSSCCSGAYGGQSSQACLCDANPCYSCKCGDAAFLTANSCTLTCS